MCACARVCVYMCVCMYRTSSSVKTAALVGAIAGQLTMGYVGDWLGRSRAMGITMSLTIVGALLSSIQKVRTRACAHPLSVC